jgi:hypothetical protein
MEYESTGIAYSDVINTESRSISGLLSDRYERQNQ